MKHGLFCVMWLLFSSTIYGQSIPNRDIEYYITSIDTTYIKNDTTHQLTAVITENISDIKSYKGQKVYPSIEVDYEPVHDVFRRNYQQLITEYVLTHRNQMPAGQYTFDITDLLIDKNGKICHYEFVMPLGAPFYNSDSTSYDNAMPTENGKKLKKQLAEMIKKSNDWQAGKIDDKAVHVYFDEPISVHMSIK